MREPSMAMPGDMAAVEYAGVGARFVALLVDVILISIVAGVIGAIFGESPGDGVQPVTQSLNLIISVAYFTYLIGSSGMTLGGRLMKVKVVDSGGNTPSYGTAAIRWVISIISGLVILLGYLWAFWDRNRQTWHDKVAGTYVVKA
ncbi:MAG: RDD family protein [Dehalococcoidia bacterium]